MTQTQTVFRKPPGPDRPVTLGIDPATLQTLQSLQAEHGDMVAMTHPNGRLAYFVNDAHEVRRILTRRHSKYVKGPGFERVKMLLGNGLIVSDGDVWRRSRTMIQPAFKTQNVHRLLSVMVECSDRLAARWARAANSGATLNITAETCDFALELILITIFGDIQNVPISCGFCPAHRTTIRALDHDGHEAVHVLAAERRLDHRARATPDVPVTHDQAIAEQHLDPLEAGPLVVLAVPTRQDEPDLVGVVDEVRESTIRIEETHHVAEIPLQTLQRRQRLGIDAERHRLVGARWPPEIGLRLGHAESGLAIALKMQAQ